MKRGKQEDFKLYQRFIKDDKKSTLAISFSFILTFLLLAVMLVLIHTNHRIANIQDKAMLTPVDIAVHSLSNVQLDELKKDTDITFLAVEQIGSERYIKNRQGVFLTKSDSNATTMMATVTNGELPKSAGEVAAERWVLLNLGIEPVIGKKFILKNEESGKEEEFLLTGILTDMFGNKKYGFMSLYTSLDKEAGDGYTAYIQLREGLECKLKMKELRSHYGLSDEQVKESPAREDFMSLYQTDVKVVSLILMICMVVFYGIYRIVLNTRVKQYGILRAIGMKKQNLQSMMLMELYHIYVISVCLGTVLGLILALVIVKLSGDADIEIYLKNEPVSFYPVIPWIPMLICIIVAACLIGIVSCLILKSVMKSSVTDIISGSILKKKNKKGIFTIVKCQSKTETLFQMGGKYIVQDFRTSGFTILTIAIGILLFTGIFYQGQIQKWYRLDTKEMWYLNGAYAMNMQYFDNAHQGLNRESVAEVSNTDGVEAVKTASGMPIRVIDEDNRKRDDAYYDAMNDRLMEQYGYSAAGYDGKNQVYKSVLYGYNEDALRELKKYVISGDYDPNDVKEDEIILSVLQMNDSKKNRIPGAWKEGTPLMQYKAGDEISIKYRTDFATDQIEYDKFSDREDEYIYKTYKIAAIVSFSYMFDCKRTVYPLLITSDKQMQNIVPDSGIQCMYVDSKSGMQLAQQKKLEKKLIQICSQSNNVATRSLQREIKQNEMFYRKQMIYLGGTGVVSLLLVLTYMVNNLKYRMQARRRELSMLRAIGMSKKMIIKMLLFENMLLGIVAVVTAFLLSWPVLQYIYKVSDMAAFGHSFIYNYGAFGGIGLVALVICGGLSGTPKG